MLSIRLGIIPFLFYGLKSINHKFSNEVAILLGKVLLMRSLIVMDHISKVIPQVLGYFIAFFQLFHPCCIHFGYRMEVTSHYQRRILHQGICFYFYVYVSFSYVY